jgi:hypothetical protein
LRKWDYDYGIIYFSRMVVRREMREFIKAESSMINLVNRLSSVEILGDIIFLGSMIEAQEATGR